MLKSLSKVSFFYFPKQQNLKPRIKTLNPENLKSKSLRVASVFIYLISISYCLDVFFECEQTRGLEGTSLNARQMLGEMVLVNSPVEIKQQPDGF